MAEDGKSEPKPKRIRFIYNKARHHRTFHADGMWAAITPQLEVQFSFFNDLAPLPDRVTHTVTEEGGLGEEVARQQLINSVQREINVTVVMNPESLKGAIELLQRMIKEVEEHRAQLGGAGKVDAESEVSQ
jgi:hypothetical protein